MTVYAPVPAQGSTLSQNGTIVSKRTKIKGPPRKRVKIETTDLDSTGETSIPGIPRGGEVEFECNINPNDPTHAALETSYDDGNTDTWVYAMSNAATYTFTGYITDFELGEVVTDGLQRASLKIQITGLVTVSA